MELTTKAIQDLLDELEASRASRKRAWENLQEIRWVLKDSAGMELPPPARKTIDAEGREVKDGTSMVPAISPLFLSFNFIFDPSLDVFIAQEIGDLFEDFGISQESSRVAHIGHLDRLCLIASPILAQSRLKENKAKQIEATPGRLNAKGMSWFQATM
jgi:hypothetical protein